MIQRDSCYLQRNLLHHLPEEYYGSEDMAGLFLLRHPPVGRLQGKKDLPLFQRGGLYLQSNQLRPLPKESDGMEDLAGLQRLYFSLWSLIGGLRRVEEDGEDCLEAEVC